MEYRFHWSVGYFGCCDYDVYGPTEIRSITVHNASESSLEYQRGIHNYNCSAPWQDGKHANGPCAQCQDPSSFERNVVSAQGGVSVCYSEQRQGPYHMDPAIYDAFVQHLREKHEESRVAMEAMYDRWNVPRAERDVTNLFIPRPIYFDYVTRRFETEPWYAQRIEARRISDGVIQSLQNAAGCNEGSF